MKKIHSCLLLLLLLVLVACNQESETTTSESLEETTTSVDTSVEESEVVANSENLEEKNVLETQVVVIGSGLSGISTAISSLQSGLDDVILVEQFPVIGPSFLSSRGNMLNAMIEENKEAHISDSTDTLDAALERWEKSSAMANRESWDFVDYDRVKEILIQSAYSIEWLENLGVDMEPSFTFEQRGQDVAKVVKQGDESEGATLMSKLEESFDELGGTKLMETRVTELLVDDGNVVGVLAEGPEGVVEIRAEAVVLATGGFGANSEMIEDTIPGLATLGYHFTGNPKNVGDAFDLVKPVDAQTYDKNWVIPAPGSILPHPAIVAKDSKLRDFNGFLTLEENLISNRVLVNRNGDRFTNEGANGVVLVADMIDLASDGVFLVFDSSNQTVVDLLEPLVDNEYIFKADSFDEFEGFENIAATMEKYNSFADNGEDPDFMKNQENLIAYGAGPYYLVSMVPDIVATIGGVVTSDDYEVMDNSGNVIGGLYAVGEVTHHFLYNRAHFANVSNSASISMGRLLGKHLADTLK